MAESPSTGKDEQKKSPTALREEEILKFWEEQNIFEKSAKKESPQGDFIFYEGPPTANGRPGIHHLEARSFKDLIPRYKIMRGFRVRRKAGWDTHGLPVELEVEKQLGLTSKRQIEEYGIAAFNKKCKESVWKYVDEWEMFTKRTAYWVDLKNPFVTYDPAYMESLWSIIGKVAERNLLYKDYKVVPWCPRCGTALSSHEIAQGYKEVKDLTLFVKFKVKDSKRNFNLDGDTFILAWTTTTWTLPGNVALAVGTKIKYSVVRSGNENYILAAPLVEKIFAGQEFEILEEISGQALVGIQYEPLYPFLENLLPPNEREKLSRAFCVYAGNFVTTEDGTGVVHTSVMYGQDDFELGTKENLPKFHTVDDTGHFVPGTGFVEGKFVKDEETEVSILKDLLSRNLLFKKEKYEHAYPFCWRCKTPLIYYARDSWYIRMSEIKDDLIAENKEIHWEPAHIREGRFGEWLEGLKDWAISRERYWGTPLPVWLSLDGSEKLVVDSLEKLKAHTKKRGNHYIVIRHGEAENNVKGICSSKVDDGYRLTERGREQLKNSALKLAGHTVDAIYVSPFLRAQETAECVAETIGFSKQDITLDARLGEFNFGEFSGKSFDDFLRFEEEHMRAYENPVPGGESYLDAKRRFGEFLYEIDAKHEGKNILIVSHGIATEVLAAVIEGANNVRSKELIDTLEPRNGSLFEFNFVPLPHNENFELDLHRPYIDQVELYSSKGTVLHRVPEVMDVWFDSGGMPFAQDHYPFENKEWIESKGFPADYISEAIDQTRGWFYTLHAIGSLMGRGKAFKNVICLGHILDDQGKKMSKSLGNIINPWEMVDTYGADVLRFWMYSVNQPGDSKNFDEKTVQEVNNKVFTLLENVLKFYELYAENEKVPVSLPQSPHVLDRWVLALFNQLVAEVTKNLEAYNVLDAARPIREFVADLSQWYVRRSRDRFKGDDVTDKERALATLRYVLHGTSRLMAPFTPFFAEYIYGRVRGESEPESVHLSSWPEVQAVDIELLSSMKEVRQIVSLALEARSRANIKVRQPLPKLSIGNKVIAESPEFSGVIQEEVNVKEIAFNSVLKEEVDLSVEITPALREEGEVREIIRALQDVRKREGLKPTDKPKVRIFSKTALPILKKHQEIIARGINAGSLEYGEAEGMEVEAGEHRLFVTIG